LAVCVDILVVVVDGRSVLVGRMMCVLVDAAPIPVLITLHSAASAAESGTASKEVLIGCVKSTPGFVRKVSNQK